MFFLAHLELLRIALKAKDPDDSGVFSKDPMQAALLQVQSWVTDTQKNKYKELLELAAAEEQDVKETSPRNTTNSKRNTSARKLPSSPTPVSNSSSNLSRTRSGKTRPILKDESSESSDDDEEIVQRRKNWKQPALKATSGALFKYARVVKDASEGCVTDEA